MKSRAKEYQWHIEWREPSELIPYEYNAKLHDDKQVKNIANSIKRFGWQQPAVVTNDDVLIIGHGRRLAALKLKCKMPVKVIEDDLTEDDIKELRLADNLTNESGWDYDLRAFDAENLSFEGFDFDLVSVEDSIDESDLDDDTQKSNVVVSVNFPDVASYEAVKERLQNIADEQKATIAVKMA